MSHKDVYVGELVELFELDFTNRGGSTIRITNNGGGFNWEGFDWLANPVNLSSQSNSIRGTLPQSSVAFSNLTGLFTANLVTTLDMVGCKVTRYLVDSSANGTSDPAIETDEYLVNNNSRNGNDITLQLTTKLGTYDVELPTKKMLIEDYPALGRVY